MQAAASEELLLFEDRAGTPRDAELRNKQVTHSLSRALG
jgi:hypothetical protein